MSELCTNYRTAKGNEVRCPECIHVVYEWWAKRPRCGEVNGINLAVGKTMTCDNARKQEPDND